MLKYKFEFCIPNPTAPNARHSELKTRNTSSFFQLIFWTAVTWAVLLIVGCSHQSSDPTATLGEEKRANCSVCPTIQQNEDTLAYINRVRRFVAKNVDTGLYHNEELDSLSNVSDADLNLERLLQIFEADSGVALCALTARINARILNDNRIETYVYTFGFEGTEFTHTLNLVSFRERLMVVDPFLNYTLLDSTGKPLNFLDLIKKPSRTLTIDYSKDTVYTDVLIEQKLLSDYPRIDSLIKATSCKDVAITEKTVSENLKKYRKARCFDCDFDNCFSFISRFESHLKKETQYTSFHQGMMLKTGRISGGKNAEKIDKRISASIKNSLAK